MIRYLQLPFHYEPGPLQAEVKALDHLWKLHFNTQHYRGNWSGISLRAPGGAADNIFAESFNQELPFEDTPLLLQCPYLQQTIHSLDCVKTSVRLLKLEQGAIVKEHTDSGLNFEQGEARLHIPIFTHPQVDFYLDGDRLEMKAGDCWYINASLPHRLANPSPADRIHLVIDCLVNDWLEAVFNREDLPTRSTRDTSDQEQQRQRQVIEELRRSGDPGRLKLADALEQALRP